MTHFWEFWNFVDSAVALNCCKAHAKISRKIGNSTPCKTVTPNRYIIFIVGDCFLSMFIFHALALPIGYLFVMTFSLTCGHFYVNFRVKRLS